MWPILIRFCIVADLSSPSLQVGYATVFFWEYFGPLALYAAIYSLPQLAYPTHKCAAHNSIILPRLSGTPSLGSWASMALRL